MKILKTKQKKIKKKIKMRRTKRTPRRRTLMIMTIFKKRPISL